RVGDLAWADGASEVDDLITGRENTDAGPPHHVDLRPADRRDQPEFGRAERTAARKHSLSRSHVLATRPHEVSRAERLRELDGRTLRDDVFLWDDTVSPLGQRRAREDPKGLARAERPVGDRSRWHAPGQRQFRRLLGAGGGGIGRAYSVAVHRRVGPGRDVAR